VNPYYSDDSCTIYHGDCRVFLAESPCNAPPLDLVLTDPPYGVNLNTAYRASQRGPLAGANDYPSVYGDDAPFDPAPFLTLAAGVVLWGANYYADKLPPRGSWLVWDKRDGSGFNDQADCELAWMDGVRGTVPRIFAHRWNGMIKASERDQARVHPTQKPLALMRWCLGFFPDAEYVLDPFMGSGTTLRAAKDFGRKAIGIEIEERYCEIAAKRLAQEVLDLEAA
jgi:site-specific DNA-methyltransferase (adenine-specific)